MTSSIYTHIAKHPEKWEHSVTFKSQSQKYLFLKKWRWEKEAFLNHAPKWDWHVDHVYRDKYLIELKIVLVTTLSKDSRRISRFDSKSAKQQRMNVQWYEHFLTSSSFTEKKRKKPEKNPLDIELTQPALHRDTVSRNLYFSELIKYGKIIPIEKDLSSLFTQRKHVWLYKHWCT